MVNALGSLYGPGGSPSQRNVDLENEITANAVATGGTYTRQISVDAGSPLKVSLVWTDFPAAAQAISPLVVNDLDLEVSGPDGTFLGNNFVGNWSVNGGSADRYNVVENVYIQNPTGGAYTVTVRGFQVPQDREPLKAGVNQDFSLVWSGALGVSGNTLPTVTISSPSSGSIFTQGDSVSFAGSASDEEDGDLTASLSWTSNLDGAIGAGGSFSTAALSVGTHTVTASVTDSAGGAGSAVVAVVIQSAGGNDPPTVTINTPRDGVTFDSAERVDFTGSATDAEDGDLTAGLSWTSSIDGFLGTGGSFSRTGMSGGAHLITASVTDSAGDPGSASVILNIQ